MRKNHNITVGKAIAIVSVIPALLYAFGGGPDPRNTGAPGDNTCAQGPCHGGTPNSGPGNVTITFPGGMTYTPGTAQRLRVTITDPDARRWGFQATARLARTPQEESTARAGTFTPLDDGFTFVLCENGLNRPSAGCPPAGPLEFIEHTAQGTRRGTSGPVFFDFDWAPPPTESGNVKIYVAANAANNDQGNGGDRIYLANYTLTPLAAGTGPKPAIISNGVVNGASFQLGVAQNTWVTIRGQNLSGTTRTWEGRDFVDGRLPTELDNVSVRINNKPAYMYFISPEQINVLAPLDSATGNVQVEVTRSGVKSDLSTVVLSQFSPGFFLFNSFRNIAARHADNSLVGPASLFPGQTTPAKPGEIISLFGTGFGQTNPPIPDGTILSGASNLVTPVTIRIGGVVADVSFQGQTATGLYQFNVKIPESTLDGDAAVTAEIGGVSSPLNISYIAVQR